MPSSRINPLALTLSLCTLAGCADPGASDEEAPSGVQQSLETENGMTTVNGFRSRNGLISTAALTVSNGLTVLNGVTVLNGLATMNGRATIGGRSVDCSDGRRGVDCTGEPDGLLSASTGLMSTDEGVDTARYLVRCALPGTDALRVVNYDGALVTFRGELGLAPEWKEGSCNGACQEKVSACLMAFTNGDGVSVDIEMSASFTLGVGHSSAFPYQEAVFYGDLFSTPPRAYYCVGEDYAEVGRSSVRLLEVRACEGYNTVDGDCPYTLTGLCNDVYGLRSSAWQDDKCSWTGPRADTAARCADTSTSYRNWRYPITTFRKVRQ